MPEQVGCIEQFKKTFGIGWQACRPMSQEEFDKRKQQQKLALLAT